MRDTGIDQIFHEVWTEMRIKRSWPRHITARWTTSPRGKSLPLPLPRSWLGIGCPTPLTHPTHPHLLGLTMRITRINVALGAAGLALIAGGLTVGATQATPFDRVGEPTPSISQSLPPVLTVATSEDDPGWRCETQGNRICGTMPEEMRLSAWKTWDASGGAEQLLVDVYSKVTLTGYTTADPYVKGGPALATGQIALADSGVWYVFTATRP